MRGGFRKLVPVAHDLSDDELVEQTRTYRRAFNEYYRAHSCASAAHAYAEAVAKLPRLRPRPEVPDDSAADPDWGDAA